MPLRKHPLRPAEITAWIAAPGQRLYYLSPGHTPAKASRAAPDFAARVILVPAIDSVATLAAAERRWCEAATREVGFAVPWLAVDELLAPLPDSPWAEVAPARRAELLLAAIACTGELAVELAVFDLDELDAGPVLSGARAERRLGLPRIDTVALEHFFFAMMAERADLGGHQVIALAAGDDDRWWLREVFSTPASLWERAVVLAPAGALAGLAMAAVAERVVTPMLARRHAVRLGAAEVDLEAPRLDPALEAALQTGAAVLAPRLASLMPSRAARLLH